MALLLLYGGPSQQMNLTIDLDDSPAAAPSQLSPSTHRVVDAVIVATYSVLGTVIVQDGAFVC